MIPARQALEVAVKLGMSFHRLVDEHMTTPGHYVYSSPDCFILANDTTHKDEPAVFVTLAVGNLQHFLSIDPKRETRVWLGFCRENEGEEHWLDYQKLRKGLSRSQI